MGVAPRQSNNSLETHAFEAPQQAQNPNAYRQWQPKPVEGETVSVERFRVMLAHFSQGFSLPVKQEKPKASEVSELDELNQWLADPILCQEVMPRVMRSENLTVEFDNYGNPLRVVEMRL